MSPLLLVRLAKIAMIAALAAFALIVTYDNIVDYDSNYEFVKHVLTMDTTFPNNALMHRAITDKRGWAAAYAAIIAVEGSICLLLVMGALALLARLTDSAEHFNRAKVWAVAGLTVGFSGFSASWWLLANTSPCGNRAPGTGRRPRSVSQW